jgi:hypothetical protein
MRKDGHHSEHNIVTEDGHKREGRQAALYADQAFGVSAGGEPCAEIA